MEALKTTNHLSVKNLQKVLQADETAYTESVGRREKAHLTNIVNHPDGAGTVVRLFFGATTEMPARGLSYITAATRIAEYVPHEQLQVVFVNRLGYEINSISRERSREQAELLANLGRKFLQIHKPHLVDKVVFGEDVPPDLIHDLKPSVEGVIANDVKMSEKLSGKGSKHGGDYLAYSSAHIVYQEMADMTPSPLTCDDPAPITPERILSVGCQQEHPFYAVRMAARQALVGENLVPSGQVFTRHLLPPYYMSRSGEQSLQDAMDGGIDLSATRDLSVHRDMSNLLKIISKEEICHEI